jgi:DNA-binding response OmpR family regulator
MARTVVLLEDQQDLGELMQIKLAKAGFAVVHRLTGLDAWHAILSEKPDLVILDTMVPGLSGLDLLTKIKADARTRHLQVIMATAKGFPKDVVAAARAGAMDYVVKPFKISELAGRMHKLLPP